EELGQAAQEKADEINRRLYLIAESDLNDARIIRRETWAATAWMPSGPTTFITPSTPSSQAKRTAITRTSAVSNTWQRHTGNALCMTARTPGTGRDAMEIPRV